MGTRIGDLTSTMLRSLCLAVVVLGASADLLEYNYYAELADTVTKMEATSSAASSVIQAVSRSAAPVKFDTVGAAFEVILLEFAGMAVDIMLAGLASAAPAAAAFGDCDPFAGYSSDIIARPFAALYDKNFWCTKL